MRFRALDDFLNPRQNVLELLLFNSHDRSKKFSISAGIYRFVCANGRKHQNQTKPSSIGSKDETTKLQNQIEALGENKPTNYFKDYLKAVLEDTSTTYYQKCDYLGLSLSEIKNKIDTLSKDIAELSELKRNLSTALEMAKELTAEIFIENGINRIDGNIISSLTLSKESTKPNKASLAKIELKCVIRQI